LVRRHIPERGDIHHLDFNPSSGHEMRGPHYCVVLSPREYNAVSDMPYVAPVTTGGKASRMAGFAVSLTGTGLSVTGVIQCDQIKALDLAARGAKPTGESVPGYILDDILARFAAIFGFEF
jgi:mRNA-degrading endonuclease toxin of MazEF toxin-antitoxin module